MTFFNLEKKRNFKFELTTGKNKFTIKLKTSNKTIFIEL